MLIGVAGPVANFILAFVAMAFYFGWINEVPATSKATSSNGSPPVRLRPRPAFSPATYFARFDNDENPDLEQVYARMTSTRNQTVSR